ncbi:MAG: hypothetical protein JOZ78_26805 [Chroococcidiopsidaceae cyanobacterium CP_BM_ER_R8_30]|nr:hypothetical protein [Chroococcidiopsidaceae cyanobacterium CP_BM_ER_R8_30]
MTIAGGLSIALATVSLYKPMQAQELPPAPSNCSYLKEVRTGKPAIRQSVATNNSNSHTDFAVPTGTSFTSYIGRLIPENNAQYRVEFNLKYNDGTSSTAVSRTIANAQKFSVYNLPFRTPTNRQPFQVNANIRSGRNNAYTVLVLACR